MPINQATRIRQAACLASWESDDFGPGQGKAVVLDDNHNGTLSVYVFGDGPMQTEHYKNRSIARDMFDQMVRRLKL